MMVPKNTIDLVTYFEGFRASPYLCSGGVATIGFGSTTYPGGKKVTLKDKPITKSQAITMMVHELERCVAAAIRLCPVLLTVKEEQLGSITDFVYNLGAGRLQQSTLRRKINAREWKSVPKELNKWVFASGKKLRGLVLRRQAESAYFS